MAEHVRSEARVRAVLFEPLDGLKRPKGLTVEAFEKMRARVMRRLSYMTEENLRGLAELVARQARGAWPKEGLVLSWAFALQVPPPRESDYVASVLRSRMGQAARDGGYLVELMRTAARLGPPPGRYMVAQMQDEAAGNRRRLAELREICARGEVLRMSDQAFVDRYRADQALAEAILRDADEERAA